MCRRSKNAKTNTFFSNIERELFFLYTHPRFELNIFSPFHLWYFFFQYVHKLCFPFNLIRFNIFFPRFFIYPPFAFELHNLSSNPIIATWYTTHNWQYRCIDFMRTRQSSKEFYRFYFDDKQIWKRQQQKKKFFFSRNWKSSKFMKLNVDYWVGAREGGWMESYAIFFYGIKVLFIVISFSVMVWV